MQDDPLCLRGFIVHAYADTRRSRLCILGRLEDGRSFAAVETRWRPSLLIYQNDSERCQNILSSINYEINPTSIESFDKKEKLLELIFGNYFHRNTAVKILEEAGIMSPDSDTKIPDAFLMSQSIRGPVELSGKARPGRIVDLVFQDPYLSAPDDYSPLNIPLKICSIDIETDVKNGTILAIGYSVSTWNEPENRNSLVRVLLPEKAAAFAKPDTEPRTLIFHHDEKSVLEAFLKDMAKIDADILTGWNFLDFDYPRLAERCELHHIPFLLGRSQEEAKYFPGAGGGAEETAGNDLGRRYSAAALVPGRQVIDALRIMRSGPRRLPGYTLEVAAQAVLGVSKTVTSSGDEKIRELESLYREDPVQFGEYCKTDAELVLQILDKTGLFRLTLERACLTGVSLDKAWTSVVSFERVYGLELYKRKIAPPAENSERDVSGAAGGTVLEPMPGIFHNVGVFDFRSLYPTIMRTFNIDPLAHARIPAEASANAEAKADTGTSEGVTDQATELIKAPNGALFSREAGILPRLIASYFEERRKAIAKGDDEASYVYKILMNSFYGVLGTSSCRYGRTELAGAITSFARKWLLFSRDWFNEKGCRVLYGDTDSLFAESGLGDNAPYAAFAEWGNSLTKELNLCLSQTIKKEYGLESCIELRFEKPYRRFMIPPLRNLKTESRGRAKGYGGWLLDSSGQLNTEVKGMEAVRSDSTALARRIQLEILERVFMGGGPDEIKAYITGILKELRQGLLDKELVYRKRLARPPETYTSSTPPQVKAARALGWKNRRGTVEYVWTVSGPEPVALPHAPLDYDHYAESQVLPVVGSIAAAAGWDTEIFSIINKKGFLNNGQIELDF